MGTLLDLASLVVVPSGYKAGTVYSVVPTDGAGDLTFTRSLDTATRVGPDGLIEKVRTNVILQSQTFDNAGWTKNAGSSVTANTTIAPDGTLTADTLNVATTTFSGLVQSFTTSTNTWTISLFVKKGTKDFLYIFDPTTTGNAYFNLTTGAVASTFSTTASITAVGNGWFRCSVTRSITGGSHSFQFGLSDADASFTPTSTGTAFIWGAQAEVSDFGATPYIPTTTAAVSVGMLANVPRLDYEGGGCPRLLLEPQRVNLVTFSDGFTNGWTASGGTITATANFGISPDGFQNSTRLQFSAANLIWRKTVSGLTGNVGTFSLYIKGTAGQTINISYGGVDLLVTLGSGFNRFSQTATGTINEVFLNTFGGATARDIEVYGGQAELGSYATSYIPTLGAAVTRSADAASKTGISALIGQTEGTLFFEGVAEAESEICNLNRSTTNSVFIYIRPTGAVSAFVYADSVGLNLISAVQSSSRFKCALAYKSNSIAFFVNGNLIHQDTSATFTPNITMDRFDINLGGFVSTKQAQTLNQALLFKTRLSNAQLQELTTL